MTLRRLTGLAAIASLAILVAGCMPQSSTSQGQAIHDLYWLFFGAATVVFVIVAGLISWSIVRYRHRGPIAPGAALPPQYHGNLVLEAIWTSLPILTVLGLFAATLVTLNTVQARSPNEVNVTVTAFQWQWRFDYADAKVTILGTSAQNPELVVPVGQSIHVTLIAADVNHAFWVPAFLFKQDAIPGHPNQFNFTVKDAGTYRGQCAEFCGVYHDRMLFTVRAVPAAEFSAWLQQQKSTGPSGSPVPAPTASVPASEVPPAAVSPSSSGSTAP